MTSSVNSWRSSGRPLFAGEPLVLPETNLVAGATASHASPLLAYALAGAALLVALIALAVALLK